MRSVKTLHLGPKNLQVSKWCAQYTPGKYIIMYKIQPVFLSPYLIRARQSASLLLCEQIEDNHHEWLSWSDNMKGPRLQHSKTEAVARLARGRHCYRSAHINIPQSIHFASNSLQLLSCKMINSHKIREQLLVSLLMWEEVLPLSLNEKPEYKNTIKVRCERSKECEE